MDLFNSRAEEDHLYTFLDNRTLAKLVYNIPTASFASIVEVVSINFGEDRQNAFPPSLSFPTDDCALVSNGNGQLIVYNTGDRTQLNNWQVRS